MVAAPPTSLEGKIRAIWRIKPACDVIEAGLLLGTDPARLTPIGQPIYGYREIYQQEIPFAEDGVYWIAAYARDEEGNVFQSSPWPVFVMVPPPFPQTSGGSHGAPPSYTGTDEDFLKPSSREPHFASLKALDRTLSDLNIFGTIESVFVARAIASTQREAVLARQSQPLQVGSKTITFDPAAVREALDRLDRKFGLLSFPRSGLYAVQCLFPPESLCFDLIDVASTSFFLLESRQTRSETIFKRDGTVSRTERFSQSSATFFVPRPPPGKRVRTAKLLASLMAVGPANDLPSGIRLNGKPPSSPQISV